MQAVRVKQLKKWQISSQHNPFIETAAIKFHTDAMTLIPVFHFVKDGCQVWQEQNNRNKNSKVGIKSLGCLDNHFRASSLTHLKKINKYTTQS